MSGIDPKVLRALAALVIVGLLVETIGRVSPDGAWVLVIILVLGAFLFTPQLSATLNNLGGSFSRGLV